MAMAIGRRGTGLGVVCGHVLGVVLVGSLAGMGCLPAAVRNLHRGCDQGNAGSCFELGVAYYEGKDSKGTPVDVNYKSARSAFTKACEKENSTACYNLGYMYQKGEGGDINKTSALTHFAKGCELGDNTACGKATLAYRDGVGTAKDMGKAVAMADLGCKRQDKEICQLYEQLADEPGDGGFSFRTRGFMAGCEKGVAESCFSLGLRFDEGKGAPQDKPKAAASYKMACDKNDLRGCHNLGVMLLDAEGIPKNVGMGYQLLDRSCSGGLKKSCEQMLLRLNRACQNDRDADACTVLGRFFIKGDKGLEANITKGVELLKRGCQLGDKDGCDDLRKLGLDPS